MVAEGERRSWPEVVRSGMYGLLRHDAEPAGADPLPAIMRLIDRAQMDGDVDMLALALAWRAWVAVTRGTDPGGSADDDLGRVLVMLETPGNPVVKATAYFRLAFSFLHRRWWELADEQYAAAERMVDDVDPFAKDPLLHRAALAYNRVMVQLDWACALREVGDSSGVADRRQAQAAAVAVAECVDMPPAWREDLRVATLLLDVVAGTDRIPEVQDCLDELAQGKPLEMWQGYLHLAKALTPEVVGFASAAEEAELAIQTLDVTESPAVYDLALHQATVLEAATAGRPTAGLRNADALALQREKGRERSVAAMRAVITSQRLRGERDLLAHHANIDPLSGLANRRGFDGHVASLRTDGVEQVAMLLFDIDNFKQVNDRYGHAAGDSVLRRVSDVLTANVRSGDFAVRFGGDEFALLLAGSSVRAAQSRSDAIAQEIAQQTWYDIDPSLRVSVSVGVAAGHPARIEALSRQADAALYRDKADHAAAAASSAGATAPNGAFSPLKLG